MEQSESGAPIYRYKKEDQKEFEGPSGESSIDEISNHIEECVGPIHMVFHELVSDKVHLDVYWVKPTKERPYNTLVTSGMSDKSMNTPDGLDDCDFAELCICLPENWKLSEEHFKDEENYWPIRLLKFMARFPHEYNTWLGYGHTMPNGDPAQPYSRNTKLNTVVLLPPISFGTDFQSLELPNKTIAFYTLIPLYTEEVELKMKEGVEALFDGFDKHMVTDLIVLDRPNTTKKKKRFGLF